MLLAITAIWLALVWSPEEGWRFQGVEIGRAPSGGEFRLDSLQGPVKLSDFQGKVVLLYFGYTWCPDICPTSLAIMTTALRQLNEAELERIQALFVSVDPERDNLERLATYAAYFHPKILGITGSPTEVKKVAKRYGVSYRRAEERVQGRYSVDHSADTYLIDPFGKLHRTVPHGTPAGEVVALLRELLE